MRLFKQLSWLIAAATALFVLQASLCALACLPAETPDSQPSQAHHDSPCHEQAPASDSSEPSTPHDDCGCESSYTAVLASPDQTSSSVHNLVVLPPHLLTAPHEAVTGKTSKLRPSETDLPPPNILLLKSTLLI